MIARHTSLAILLPLLALALSGCTTTGKHWWSPATWMSSKPAERVVAAETRLTVEEDKAVHAARGEVAKAATALISAPDSRPVEVARRTVENAQILLDQVAGPLTAEEATEIRKLVADLLSEKAEIRTAAERRQAKDEAEILELSSRVAEYGTKLEEANNKLEVAFAKENALADELRNERARRIWIIGGGTVLLLIVGGGWLWLQISTGGLPKAIGGLLKGLDEKDPAKADLIRSLLDPVTNRIEQKLIRKHT